jgi:hypothetical protein
MDSGQSVGWVKRSAAYRSAIAVGFATIHPPEVPSALLPLRLLADGVVNVKYLYRFARDPIKYLVWIPDEGNDSHTGTLYHLFRTHWPLADTALDTPKSLLKRCRYARIIGANERQNFIQIARPRPYRRLSSNGDAWQ